MRFNFLLLFVVSLCAGSYSTIFAQTSTYEGPLRGEMAAPPTDNLELEATLETVKLDIMISEIEDAGYSMDVNEGFDEEWEEEIWIASDADEMEALLIPADESDIMEFDEVISQEELLEEWEDPTWVELDITMEETDAVSELDNGTESEWEEELWEGEISADESEFALLSEENEDLEAEEVEEWWIAEDGLDESWEDLQEEWEIEALEDAYESEDMEYMEMMYGF